MKSKILLVGLLCSLSARADTLATQIESFIKSKFNDNAVQVKVLVRTPPAQWPPCELPLLSLPPNARIGGNISVSARCGQERRFIQTQVQVFGRYLTAARGISGGCGAKIRQARYPAAAYADRQQKSAGRGDAAEYQPRPTADALYVASRVGDQSRSASAGHGRGGRL